MGKMKKPKAPKTTHAVQLPPIPVQDGPVTDASRKKAMAQMQQRGGVAATVLSDTLGG